jgi:hypothetical protein
MCNQLGYLLVRRATIQTVTAFSRAKKGFAEQTRPQQHNSDKQREKGNKVKVRPTDLYDCEFFNRKLVVEGCSTHHESYTNSLLVRKRSAWRQLDRERNPYRVQWTCVSRNALLVSW